MSQISIVEKKINKVFVLKSVVFLHIFGKLEVRVQNCATDIAKK